MSLIKEDWERAHLMDELYLKEIEFQEMEYYATGQKPPAKITLLTKKKAKKKYDDNAKKKSKI